MALEVEPGCACIKVGGELDAISAAMTQGGTAHCHCPAATLAPQVDGTKRMWQAITRHMYQRGADSAISALPADVVLQLVPVAHKFGLSAVLADCVDYALKLEYVNYAGLSCPSSPVPWLQLASRLEVSPCIAGIAGIAPVPLSWWHCCWN